MAARLKIKPQVVPHDALCILNLIFITDFMQIDKQ